MLGEPGNRFSLTRVRAALSTCGRAKSKCLLGYE